MKKIPDENIIKLLQDENTRTKAFSSVVQTYQEQLYWLIRKMVLSHEDTNDILQNTFLKAWSGLDSFRGDSQISTWLHRIAINETYTFLANLQMRNIENILDVENIMVQNLQSDSYFSGAEAQLKLQKAILSLPPKQRMVFNMKYFEERKYEEMEEILGTSIGALKASYHHAVKKIENFILTED